MNAFAIIRHKKIKAGRHLVATGLHNVRGIDTPNADKDAAPIEIMVGSRKPWRDVANVLRHLRIERIRANGNVAIEVFLGASPDWWRSKGWKPGVVATGGTLALVEDWKAEQLAYLNDRFGRHLIASVVFHPDEASPHIQALIVPAQFRKDGREKGEGAGRNAWRLSTEKVLPGPSAMKSIVTDYARRMEPFGLVRGEDRPTGTTRHKPLKEWQEEQALLSEDLGREIMRQINVTEEAAREAERIKREAHDYAAKVKALADKEAKEARVLAEMREEMLRRKEDATNAARLEIQAEHRRAADMVRVNEEERDTLKKLRNQLEDMIAQVEKMMEPIRAYAAKWLQAKPLMRQAIGAKGPDAVRIASDEQARELEAMRKFMSARGLGR